MKKILITLLLLFCFLINVRGWDAEPDFCDSKDKAGDGYYARCNLSSSTNYVVQVGSKYQGIAQLYMQQTVEPVFCILRGAASPAYGAGGDYTKRTCSKNYSFSSNNDSFRAAIGKAILELWNYEMWGGEGWDYVEIQHAIHQLLYEFNNGASARSYVNSTLYQKIKAEYLKYRDQSISFNSNSLSFSTSGNNLVATVNITKSGIDNLSVEHLKAGNTNLSKEYVTISNNTVTITIPRSQITGTSTISLKLKGTSTYHMTTFKDCGDGVQPIALANTGESKDRSVYDDITGSVLTYKFDYDANGGTGTMTGHTVSYGSKLTVKPNEFTRPGYKFVGWHVKNVKTGKWYCSGWKDENDCNTFANYNNRTVTINNSWKVDGDDKREYIFYAQWELETKTITVNKIEPDRTPIQFADITFELHESEGCQDSNPLIFKVNTGGSGSVVLEDEQIKNQSYWIKETHISKSKSDYVASNECIEVPTEDTSVDYINEPGCHVLFKRDKSIKNRLEMYFAKYRAMGYNGLLDFNELDESDACSGWIPSYQNDLACLNNRISSTSFSVSDLSDFNQLLDLGDMGKQTEDLGNGVSDHKGFCLIDIEIEPVDDEIYDQNRGIRAGKLILDLDEDDNLLSAELKKVCYIHKDSLKEDYQNVSALNAQFTSLFESDYSDISSMIEVSVDKKKLTPAIKSKGNVYISEDENNFYKLEQVYEIEYKPNVVYAEKITGKLPEHDNDCLDSNGSLKPSCRKLGYGVASRFDDAQNSNPTFNFSVVYKEAFLSKLNLSFYPPNCEKNDDQFICSFDCPYEVAPEIIEYESKDSGNLELEFRVVDTNKPFNRNTKSNWKDEDDSAPDNQKVKEFIMNRVNSYGFDQNGVKQKSLYHTENSEKIVLTPDLIQKVREYNAGTGTGDCANSNPSYNDYTVHKVDDGSGNEITTTNFFKCIGLTKVQ